MKKRVYTVLVASLLSMLAFSGCKKEEAIIVNVGDNNVDTASSEQIGAEVTEKENTTEDVDTTEVEEETVTDIDGNWFSSDYSYSFFFNNGIASAIYDNGSKQFSGIYDTDGKTYIHIKYNVTDFEEEAKRQEEYEKKLEDHSSAEYLMSIADHVDILPNSDLVEPAEANPEEGEEAPETPEETAVEGYTLIAYDIANNEIGRAPYYPDDEQNVQGGVTIDDDGNTSYTKDSDLYKEDKTFNISFSNETNEMTGATEKAMIIEFEGQKITLFKQNVQAQKINDNLRKSI